MKKISLILITLYLASFAFAQSVLVKDSDTNTLMQVDDKGTTGELMVSSTIVDSLKLNSLGGPPVSTASKLYNEGGTLKWSGSALGTAASPDGDWTISGSNIYSTVSGNVGIGTTSPTALLHVSGDDGLLVQGVKDVGVTQNLGAGARMHFYPKKAAFRAGHSQATNWDDANIGEYSVGMNSGTRASGRYSTAFGQNTIASGFISTAMGSFTTASGDYSNVMGHHTKAESWASVAIGKYNVGGGTYNSWISTDPLFEIGNGVDDANRDNAMTVLKNGKVGIGTANPTSKLSIVGLEVYADNSAALSGGLVAGDLYRTGDLLKIVH